MKVLENVVVEIFEKDRCEVNLNEDILSIHDILFFFGIREEQFYIFKRNNILKKVYI